MTASQRIRRAALPTTLAIVTNAHVAGDARTFQVQLAGDPKPRAAALVGSYAAGDLAVIRVADRSGLEAASFGHSDQARTGDVVLAVGNPLGLASSVTEGIGFAIPANLARAIAGQLIASGQVTSGG